MRNSPRCDSSQGTDRERDGDAGAADEILAEWGEAGQDAARESLWIDFGFLLAYGAFLTLALRAVRSRTPSWRWRSPTSSRD